MSVSRFEVRIVFMKLLFNYIYIIINVARQDNLKRAYHESVLRVAIAAIKASSCSSAGRKCRSV